MSVNENKGVITRAEQKQLTRKTLIDTTVDVIAKDGFSGVTMAKVAERAGLSRGICNFHFQTKEQLLLETLKALYQEFESAWQGAIAEAGSLPFEQIRSLIKTNLEPPVADAKKIAVWLAYWGETPSRATYLKICQARDIAWEKAVEAILRQMSKTGFTSHGMSLAKIAQTLTAMMDGIWVEYLLSPDRLSPKEAVQACYAYLCSFFPGFDENAKSNFRS
ncbi:MAG: TetR family transcriptional regulator C-terminal domain-containing protein [Desulfobacterales bacterium]|nr:MAG: TetR family transcriptional regulator C-terminal domain-containing protein [Desulfobacterales bacterium]